MRERNEVTGALSSGLKLYPVGEISKKPRNIQPSYVEIPRNVSMEKHTHSEDGVIISSAVEVPVLASQDGPPTVIHTPTGGVSHIPDYRESETVLVDLVDESVHYGNEDEGSSAKKTRGKGKISVTVASSWSLRSKSQEKHKSPEPNETVKRGGGDRETKKSETKSNSKKGTSLNEFSKIKTHFRYLLHRIKYEQSLIDAYCAEGWKGQSLEKLKPQKELERAKSHILRYKLKIRLLVEHLDHLLSAGKLPEILFDSKGEIDSEDIFCAKCGSKDLTLENDIVLCDGACERGFHQFCLEPPLLKVPPGDESWICPGCDCKIYCIDMLRDYHGHKVSLNDSWENIFPEAAGTSSGNNLGAVTGSSDDSEDDDYDPEKLETSQKVNGDQSNSNESEYFSAPDDSVPSNNNQVHEGLPSEDSEDDDFDPTAPHDDEQVKGSSSSSDFSSDSEDLEALIEDEARMGVDSGQVLPILNNEQLSADVDHISDDGKKPSLIEELSYLHDTAPVPVSDKRHVPRLDYQKLHDEAYGNCSSDSSDEDFEDCSTKKKRRSVPEGGACSNTKLTTGSGKLVSRSRGSPKKLPHKRLGEATTQKLHSSFLENMYPERSVKEKLATELGISIRQVSKWFENARRSYHHHGPKQQNQADTTRAMDSLGAIPSEVAGEPGKKKGK